MKNDAWAEFVGIRDQQRFLFAQLVSVYLSGNNDDRMVGRIGGALHLLTGLPYSHGAEDELRRAIDPAHRLNRDGGYACGCAKRKRCHLDEVSPDRLLRTLAETDRPLRISDPDDLAERDWDDL